MRNGEGFALIFAINNQRSLTELSQIRTGILKAQGEDIPMVLVANKCDLPEKNRKVSEADIADTAKEWYLYFLAIITIITLFLSFVNHAKETTLPYGLSERKC